jgi:hypothetical protein
MRENKAPQYRNPLTAAKSPIEIPPPPRREHLTEPSWLENMIYMTGILLKEAHVEIPDAKPKPPKSNAA